MINPATMMKVMNAKRQFEQDHPKFAKFMGDLIRNGVSEGSIIEITLTNPDGSSVTTNMKVKPSDIELVRSLKEIGTN